MSATCIEWTDRSWNFLAGCGLVSPGCTNCYAMKQAARIGRMNPGLAHYQGLTKPSKAGPVWTGKIGIAEHKLLEPLSVKKPAMWFVNSMSDLFHPDVPDDVIDRAFAVMALCPQHTFQILTKRPERMQAYFSHERRESMIVDALCGLRRPIAHAVAVDQDGGQCMAEWPLPNVWLGTSVENKLTADKRIPHLLATPASVRWVSAEPLLGPVDVVPYLFIYTHDDDAALACDCNHTLPFNDPATTGPENISTPRLDWVVVGGESGPGARPMHPDWARSLRDQCKAADVPFFFKQWGSFETHYDRDRDDPDYRECGRVARLDSTGQWLNLAGGQGFHGERVVRVSPVGKARAGRLLDGIEHNAMPESRFTSPLVITGLDPVIQTKGEA